MRTMEVLKTAYRPGSAGSGMGAGAGAAAFGAAFGAVFGADFGAGFGAWAHTAAVIRANRKIRFMRDASIILKAVWRTHLHETFSGTLRAAFPPAEHGVRGG